MRFPNPKLTVPDQEIPGWANPLLIAFMGTDSISKGVIVRKPDDIVKGPATFTCWPRPTCRHEEYFPG